jgi:hypothetical protein
MCNMFIFLQWCSDDYLHVSSFINLFYSHMLSIYKREFLQGVVTLMGPRDTQTQIVTFQIHYNWSSEKTGMKNEMCLEE